MFFINDLHFVCLQRHHECLGDEEQDQDVPVSSLELAKRLLLLQSAGKHALEEIPDEDADIGHEQEAL